MPSCGYKLIVLGTIVTLLSRATVSTAQEPETKDYKEGANVVVNCNVTDGPTRYVFWTNDNGRIWEGTVLNLTNVTRAYKGLYRCIDQNNSSISKREMEIKSLGKEVYSFYLNVLYPPHVDVINGSNSFIKENKTFWMYVNVTGNPTPKTTFTSTSSGKVYFTAFGEGLYNITVPSLNCTDTGQYELRCDNSQGNTSQMKDVFVLCPPIPNPEYQINTTVAPRLRQHVNLTVHVIGYPPPNYTWWYEGTGPLPDHIDIGYITVLLLKDFLLQDYGDYTLVMENDQGKNSVVFKVIEDGPPDPVTSLTVSDVTFTSAKLNFITGYDYNSTQTFVVQREVEGKLIDFRNKTDEPGDFGERQESILITDLDEFTDYNFTITSRNKRGDSAPSESFVNFSTSGSKPVPDPDFPPVTEYKPRLGENVILTIHALHAQNFRWEHDGKHINSTDQANRSDVYINNVVLGDFGEYTLNMSNKAGYYIVVYNLLADGPPDTVSHLNVTNVTINSADITFVTGYNYNHTQTFIVMSENMELTSCKDGTSGKGGEPFSCPVDKLDSDKLYSITVISNNSRGESNPSSAFPFTTYGVPKPDPKKPVNDTFQPRIQDTVTMTIYAVGYPAPTYHWWHNEERLNSSDSQYISTVTVHIKQAKDFGTYSLNMTNVVGNFSKSYEVLAHGPPEPVSQLSVSNINTSTARINFLTGYNYNDTQTFMIMAFKDGNLSGLSSCLDTTSGNGGEMFDCEVEELMEDILYNITVISKNSHGESTKSSFLTFTTYGKPKPDPAKSDNDTFTPRLQDVVTMTIHAVGYPPPRYEWWHNGSRINSSDTNYTSTVTVEILESTAFGEYILNMTNEVGHFSKAYQVLAHGPPAAVSDENVSDITDSSASLSFVSGYDYNDTQTFIVLNYTDGEPKEIAAEKGQMHDNGGTPVTMDIKLKSLTYYNITVIANNSRGESEPVHAFLNFTSLGKPAHDPNHKDNLTAAPRLGANITLMYHAVGNPLPSFRWYHNKKQLNHTNTGAMSCLPISNFTVDNFGTYTLTMSNSVGETDVTFDVQEDGPPEPARDLVAGNIKSDSVELYWRPGFNYGSDQTFTVIAEGVSTPLKDSIPDTTNGDLSKNETYSLNGLGSSTNYTIYVQAKNARGTAYRNSNTISFKTGDSDDGGTTAEIVGYVVGGIGFVVLILVIISLIRCYMARRAHRYVSLEQQPREQEQEERPREPHHYRYDDAATP